MGHASLDKMVASCRSGEWSEDEVTESDVKAIFKHEDCIICSLTKWNANPTLSGSGFIPNQPGSSVSIDEIPKISPPAIGGQRHATIAIDAASTLSYVFVHHDLTQETFQAHVNQLKVKFKKGNWKIKKLRYDAGTTGKSQFVQDFLDSEDIIFQNAPAEQQNQNPVERFIQTLIKMTSAILLDCVYLGPEWWSYALIHASNLWNSMPNSKTDGNSPYYLFYGVYPPSYLFYFGQPVSVKRLMQEKELKFEARRMLGFVVGFPNPENPNKSTVCFVPAAGGRKIITRRDVQAIKLPTPKYPYKDHSLILPQIYDQVTGEINFKTSTVTGNDLHEIVQPSFNFTDADVEFVHSSSIDCKSDDPDEDNIHESDFDQDIITPLVRFDDHGPPSSRTRSKISVIKVTANPTFNEILKSPDLAKWKASMEKELDQLLEHNTYSRISQAESNYAIATNQVVPTNGVFKVKEDAEGNPTNHKTRVVYLSNVAERLGIPNTTVIPFNEQFKHANLAEIPTFAPTPTESSLKMFEIIVLTKKMFTENIDFMLAFCSATAKRPLYIRLPSNILKLLSNPKYPDEVYKLEKTLYGLPEAPRSFNDLLHEALSQYGFKNTIYEPCLYTLETEEGSMAILLTVDDTRVGYTRRNDFDKLYQTFEDHPQLIPTVQPNPESYTGYRIEHNSNGTVSLSQPGYLKKLFFKYKIDDSSPYFDVPMDPKFSDEGQNDSPPYDLKAFQELIGELMFATKTRKECIYSVHRMASRTQHHTVKDYQAAIRILCYLYWSKDLKLTFTSSDNFSSIIAWSDAAYNVYQDSKSQISWCIGTSNFDQSLPVVPFYVKSEKEDIVATSPTEAETGAAVGAVKSVLAWRNRLEAMGFPQIKPTVIWVDNSALLSLSKSTLPSQHKRVRHYMLKINFIIDCIKKGLIELRQVKSEDNLADILTKPLGKRDFQRHRHQLLGLHLQNM
jgi:hypothetical protein